MDINKIDATLAQDEEGAVIPIYGKDGEPDLASDGTPTTIAVVGTDSARYRRATDAQTRKTLRNRHAKLTPDDIRNSRVDLAASAVIDWHGIEDDGKSVPCTPENVKMVLRAPYILEQVEAGIQGHADFFSKKS